MHHSRLVIRILDVGGRGACLYFFCFCTVIQFSLICLYLSSVHFLPFSGRTKWPTRVVVPLTLKAPITTAADDNFFIYFFYFSEKTSLDISCESSAWQMIHMKCQDLFSLKNKKKIFRMLSATNFAWGFKD